MSKLVWVIRRKTDLTFLTKQTNFGGFDDAKIWTHKPSAKGWITGRNRYWYFPDNSNNYEVIDCIIKTINEDLYDSYMAVG